MLSLPYFDRQCRMKTMTPDTNNTNMPKITEHQSKKAHIARVIRFGAVGVANTGFDYMLFNILGALGAAAVPANLASTSAAMIFSYFANKIFVFRDTNQTNKNQIFMFFAVTATGVWIIQSIVLWVVLHKLGVVTTLSKEISVAVSGDSAKTEVIARNIAKLFATVASLTWNYVLYHFVVFKSSQEPANA